MRFGILPDKVLQLEDSLWVSGRATWKQEPNMFRTVSGPRLTDWEDPDRHHMIIPLLAYGHIIQVMCCKVARYWPSRWCHFLLESGLTNSHWANQEQPLLLVHTCAALSPFRIEKHVPKVIITKGSRSRFFSLLPPHILYTIDFSFSLLYQSSSSSSFETSELLSDNGIFSCLLRHLATGCSWDNGGQSNLGVRISLGGYVTAPPILYLQLHGEKAGSFTHIEESGASADPQTIDQVHQQEQKKAISLRHH